MSFNAGQSSNAPKRRTSTRASQAGGQRLQTVRIGDINREAAQRRAQARVNAGGTNAQMASARAQHNYRVYLVRILAVLGLIAALVVGYIAAYNSSLFTIEEVSVKGVEHLTATDLQNLAGVEQGNTLLRVDTESIRKALMVDAWVQDVKVNRIFPHTLELDVTERTITAVVKVPSQDGSTTVNWAIASDGMWLMPIPEKGTDAAKLVTDKVYEDADKALVISDVPYSTKPEVGTYCSDANVNNALAIVAGLTTELADKVVAVKAAEAESTTVTIKDGPDIVFGTPDNLREKERVCLQIMEQHPDGVSYINVRSVDRPTYRAL